MTLIGMPEAGKRAGVSAASILRSLRNAEVPLVAINGKAFAVEETDLQSFLTKRGDYKFGRPPGAKNKPKPSDGDLEHVSGEIQKQPG
jgi:hypothetical protein